MNTWKNIYGAAGLISTIGKNSFAAGENISWTVKNGCHYVQKVVDIDLVVIGPVFNKLETVSESIEGFNKSVKEWFTEKETSYNEKYEQAKKQEELNKDWEWNANPSFAFAKNYPGLVGKKGVVERLKEKYFPQTKLETSEKAVYRPNYLRYLGIYF